MAQSYEKMLEAARQRNDSLTRLERDVGFAPPQHCDLSLHLRTVESALEAGVKMKDWSTVCEGIVLLQDALKRTGEYIT
jgi:hypothetical protein